MTEPSREPRRLYVVVELDPEMPAEALDTARSMVERHVMLDPNVRAATVTDHVPEHHHRPERLFPARVRSTLASQDAQESP